MKFIKEREGNTSLVKKGDKIVTSKPTAKVSPQQAIMSAEILQALHVVDSGLPFASAESDGDRFRLQFPDSAITKGYKQGKTKITYVIQHGIVPYIADLLQQDIASKPFSFKFDETTTSQIKKQYDAYLTYYSEEKKHTTTAYCGSVSFKFLNEYFLY